MGSIDFDRVRQEYPIGKAVKTMEDGHIYSHVVWRYILEASVCYIDMEDGRRYLLDRLRSMEVKKAPGTVELSEAAVIEICEHYCKHPFICTSDEELQDVCEQCPLVGK